MSGRRVTFDTEKALELLKKGFKYKYIAKELKIKENTLKKFLTRHAADELALKKNARKSRKNDEEFTLESSNLLTLQDRKEILNSRSNGINLNESMSTNAFLDYYWPSYYTDGKTGRVRFDSSRGARTKDVPASYMPGEEFKNKYKCLILTNNGLKKHITVRAYDTFYARNEARKKINDVFEIIECEKVL